MTAISGQTRYYAFNVSNNTSTPLNKIAFYTSREIVSLNVMKLELPNNLSHDVLSQINTFVNERFQHFGALLLTPETDQTDHSFILIEAANARGVVDDLFSHNEMSAGNRSDIEYALRELEKSASLAGKRTESISTAQKDIIMSLVSPYIDDIKSETPSSEMAKKWILRTARALSTWGPSSKQWIIDNWFQRIGRTESDFAVRKSDNFYESLFAVAKIYISMADLEGALEQSGTSLPSGSIIKQTILDMFD